MSVQAWHKDCESQGSNMQRSNTSSEDTLGIYRQHFTLRLLACTSLHLELEARGGTSQKG